MKAILVIAFCWALADVIALYVFRLIATFNHYRR